VKLATFRLETESQASLRLGVLVETLEKPALLDLLACPKAGHPTTVDADVNLPTAVLPLLRRGETGFGVVRDTVDSVLSQVSSLEDPEAGDVLVPLGDVTLGPAIPNPGKIISAGLNFSEHVGEAASLTSDAPECPMAFIKVSTTVSGHEQPIILPQGVSDIDYEVELAIVIGKKGKRIAEADAMDYVAGYAVFNDVSARAIQFREMEKGLLNLGKNFDTFGPLGPWLVTKDEIADVQDLDLMLRVNGELRQQGNTAQMIHSVSALVAYWSQMTLEPGDVITSGTPSGVAAFREPDPTPYYLKPGDVVEASIEGLGTLRNPVSSG